MNIDVLKLYTRGATHCQINIYPGVSNRTAWKYSWVRWDCEFWDRSPIFDTCNYVIVVNVRNGITFHSRNLLSFHIFQMIGSRIRWSIFQHLLNSVIEFVWHFASSSPFVVSISHYHLLSLDGSPIYPTKKDNIEQNFSENLNNRLLLVFEARQRLGGWHWTSGVPYHIIWMYFIVKRRVLIFIWILPRGRMCVCNDLK